MSEEDGNDSAIIVRKLPWRSDSMFLMFTYFAFTYFLCRAEWCYDLAAANKSHPGFVPDRKERLVSPLPSSTPDWALQPEYRKG